MEKQSTPKSHKVAIKRPGKPLEVVDFEGTYRCDVKPLIDNEPDTYLQYVAIRNVGDRCLCMACDDSALMKQLPFNFNMLTISGNHSFYEKITGTVIFMVYQWVDVWEHEIWDFELLDLNEDDIQYITRMLSKEAQQNMMHIAATDPFVVREPKLVFDPIDDLTEYLMPTPPELKAVPLFLLASYLFTKWPVNQQISFLTDKKQRHEYITGISKNVFSSKITVFCRCKTLAHEFTIEKDTLPSAMAESHLFLQQYLSTLHAWSLPAFVYVTRETCEKITMSC